MRGLDDAVACNVHRKVYELTCASKSIDELSPTCRRVLRSLHIEKPGL